MKSCPFLTAFSKCRVKALPALGGPPEAWPNILVTPNPKGLA